MWVKEKDFINCFQMHLKNVLIYWKSNINFWIKRLLVFNPKNRITIEEALAHPYVADFHVLEEEIVCKNPIEISMNDNKKFSIREYRDAIYTDINTRNKDKRKKDVPRITES